LLTVVSHVMIFIHCEPGNQGLMISVLTVHLHFQQMNVCSVLLATCFKSVEQTWAQQTC